MPELPEVETTCRGIREPLLGSRATGAVVRNSRLRQPVPAQLGELLAGQVLRDVRRRAKYLLLDFDTGSVIVHLGMSGSLRVVATEEKTLPHDHVDIVFGLRALRLRDPRRFGMMLWQPGDGLAHPVLASLGPEPLGEEFDGEVLYRTTRGLRAPIKQVLMDARRVVGVGNIYASESLFRARIHPLSAAGSLGRQRCERLAAAVKETLRDAIAAGGSTLRDFVGGDGRPGYFQQHYFVYSREGLDCKVCGRPVMRELVAQRATYWCGKCQRR